MDESILITIKKQLGMEADYTAFDSDIILLINSAFSRLSTLGVGPETAFRIEDESESWLDFDVSASALGMVKEWIFLRVKNDFDPDHTSFVLDAREKRLEELTWILNSMCDAE